MIFQIQAKISTAVLAKRPWLPKFVTGGFYVGKMAKELDGSGVTSSRGAPSRGSLLSTHVHAGKEMFECRKDYPITAACRSLLIIITRNIYIVMLRFRP